MRCRSWFKPFIKLLSLSAGENTSSGFTPLCELSILSTLNNRSLPLGSSILPVLACFLNIATSASIASSPPSNSHKSLEYCLSASSIRPTARLYTDTPRGDVVSTVFASAGRKHPTSRRSTGPMVTSGSNPAHSSTAFRCVSVPR